MWPVSICTGWLSMGPCYHCQAWMMNKHGKTNHVSPPLCFEARVWHWSVKTSEQPPPRNSDRGSGTGLAKIPSRIRWRRLNSTTCAKGCALAGKSYWIDTKESPQQYSLWITPGFRRKLHLFGRITMLNAAAATVSFPRSSDTLQQSKDYDTNPVHCSLTEFQKQWLVMHTLLLMSYCL